MPLHSDGFFLTSNYLGCLLPGHHSGEEVVWLGHHLAMPLPAQLSSWIHKLYIYYVNCITYSLKLKLGSWKRDFSSVALSEVSSIIFYAPVERFFFSQYAKVFLTRIQGLRTDCKAHCGNVIVILDYVMCT